MIDEVPAAPAVRSPAAANGTSAPRPAPEPAAELAARPGAAANGSSGAVAAQEQALQSKVEASPAANGSTAAHAADRRDTVTVAGPGAAVAEPHAREIADTHSEGAGDPPSSSAPQAARPAPGSTEQHTFTEAFGSEGGGGARGADAPAIGPAMPPSMGLPDGDSEGPDEGAHPGAHAGGAGEAAAGGCDDGAAGVGEGAAGGGAEQGDGASAPAAPSRVVGPAVPSAELLRAAAEATEAVRLPMSRSPCSHQPVPPLLVEMKREDTWKLALHACVLGRER